VYFSLYRAVEKMPVFATEWISTAILQHSARWAVSVYFNNAVCNQHRLTEKYNHS